MLAFFLVVVRVYLTVVVGYWVVKLGRLFIWPTVSTFLKRVWAERFWAKEEVEAAKEQLEREQADDEFFALMANIKVAQEEALKKQMLSAAPELTMKVFPTSKKVTNKSPSKKKTITKKKTASKKKKKT